MHAIVDEPGRAIFVVIAAPDHVEHVAQRGLADLAALAVAVDVEHFLNRLQLLAAEDLAQVVLRKRHASADDLLRLLLKVRGDGFQQRLTERRAASASRARARRFLQLRQRADALLVNRLDDRGLGHADTAAHGRAFRHPGDVEAGIRGRRREQQMPSLLGEIRSRPQPIHVAMAV